MTAEIETDASTPAIDDALLPDRYPQHDLFICDVADAVLKDLMPQMEHPFYSLSKKPETTVRRYSHNENWIEITPSVKGLATIYDKDILIYCISQIMAKLKRGEKVSRRVRINAHELLMFTNRGIAGKDYKALIEALDRLEGTRIRTNIKTGDEEQTEGFGLVDASTVMRKHGLSGRMQWVELKLSDWVFNAIRSRDVLTLHPNYFRLRKPIERRVYELARKHCGTKHHWSCSIEILHRKSGSRSTLREFRRAIREISEVNHLPDYDLELSEDGAKVAFYGKGTVKVVADGRASFTGYLKDETYERAREIAPGYDVYAIEQDWRAWMAEGMSDPPSKPDTAFLGFCRKWYERRASV